MFRLAHLSDAHLGPLPDVTYRELASKRVVGYINWQKNRRRHMQDAVIDAITDDMKAHAPDHVAVTGDLVNLALDSEIDQARQWLEALGAPQHVSVVPGNHDAYVPGAFAKVCHSWGPWMSGDGQETPVDQHSFPYLRIRGQVALIGVSTARATVPFMANGYLREEQGRRLEALLDMTRARGLCRVVMIHHPPVRGAVKQHKRLFGIGRFEHIMARSGAELVLHGHSHLPTLHYLAGVDGRVPVVGVAAAGQAPGTKRPPAQYNLIDIEAEGRNWRLQLTRRGLEATGQPLVDFEMRELIGGTKGPLIGG